MHSIETHEDSDVQSEFFLYSRKFCPHLLLFQLKEERLSPLQFLNRILHPSFPAVFWDHSLKNHLLSRHYLLSYVFSENHYSFRICNIKSCCRSVNYMKSWHCTFRRCRARLKFLINPLHLFDLKYWNWSIVICRENPRWETIPPQIQFQRFVKWICHNLLYKVERKKRLSFYWNYFYFIVI